MEIGRSPVISSLRHSQMFDWDPIASSWCSEAPWPRSFPKPADIQAEMVAEDILPKLRSLLASGSEDVRCAAVALLWVLSQHPPNQVGEVISQDQSGKSSSGHHVGWHSVMSKLDMKWVLRVTNRLCETSQPREGRLPSNIIRFCLLHVHCH